MIVDTRYTTFVNSFQAEKSPFLAALEEEAIQADIPIIRRETQSLLSVLLSIKKPKRVLEIGTAVGFSALFMLEHLPEDAYITTIENYAKRIPVAQENFRKAGAGERIRLIEGDAGKILPDLCAGTPAAYDMIFMDAAKGQYLTFLENALALLAPEGILIADNVLQDGDLIESRYAVTRRDRTIHKRMREFLYRISHDDRLTTTILTVGDGVSVSTKK